MKRIKQIIESFLNIGRDPNVEIASAWARVVASATAASEADLALVDRIIAGALQQSTEMKTKAKAESEARS